MLPKRYSPIKINTVYSIPWRINLSIQSSRSPPSHQSTSPLISGSSVGISGDCSDAQLLEQYYAYCAGTLDCAGLLEQFDTYVPVTPLVYRQGGAVVSPSFQAKMTPISQDIFYNIDEWQ